MTLKKSRKKLTRRDFIKRASVVVAGVTVGGLSTCSSNEPADVTPVPTQTPSPTDMPEPTEISEPTAEPEPTETPEQEVEQPEEETVETYDVIIVGAGIAGLTAAYYLQDYNLKALERGHRVGGRVISGSYQGFSYAKGTEYLGEPGGALAEILKALNVQLKEIPAPMDAHFHNGKFYYGEDGMALMHIEAGSLAEYNRFVSAMQQYYDQYDEIPEFDLDSDLADLDDITAQEWFDRHNFPPIFYETYNVMAKGLFGARLDEISALSAIPEIVFDFEDAEPITDIEDLENTPDPEDERSKSYSFTTGITELTDAIAQYLGDKVQANSPVMGVVWKDERYIVTYSDQSGNERNLTAGVVILANPAPVALKIAAEVLNQEQQELMAQVPYAVYVTAALYSDEPIFDQAFDLAVPDGYFFTDVYDSTWVQRRYDASLKDKKSYITGVYVAPVSYEDRSLLDMPDDDILENIYLDLEKIFPGVRDKVVGYDIQRFPYAYPIMTVGAYKRLSHLHEITEGDLLLAGDYMIYPTFESAVQSGYLAAQKAKAELG